MIFCNKGLEKEEALALKVLANLGGTSGYVYGDQPALKKPVLSQLGPKPSAVDQLEARPCREGRRGGRQGPTGVGEALPIRDPGPRRNPEARLCRCSFLVPEGFRSRRSASVVRIGDYLPGRSGNAQESGRVDESFDEGRGGGICTRNGATLIRLCRDEDSDEPLSGEPLGVKSADSGDSQGLLARGDLYKAGILGAERSVWPVEAMYEYKKSADKGNCVAMLNIGTLYLNGEGVIQDKSQAQTWFSKAEVCEGGDLDSIRQKATEYRDKVVAGAGPLFGEIPIPAKGGTGLSDGQKLLVGVAALFALSMAMDCSKTQQPCTGNGEDGLAGIIQNQQNLAHVDCVQRFGLGGLC